ncbi:hypothetical protein [Streptosporangium sp. NPDC002607]
MTKQPETGREDVTAGMAAARNLSSLPAPVREAFTGGPAVLTVVILRRHDPAAE